MSDVAYETFSGLNQALDGRWAIRKKCQAVELCLDANRDNYRGFFEQCFSQLLKQIFGYDGSSWLDQVAQVGEEANARALEGLLSPNGKLFRAMHSADADGLIKFMFPLERLPTHTQLLLASEASRKELERWPQYRGRIFQDPQGRTQIHLNVLSYFLFWMAFYVLRGSQAQSLAAPSRAARYNHLTPSFGSVKKTLGLTRNQQPVEEHPYLRLLRLYLEEFLPRDGMPAGGMKGLRSSGGAGSSHMLVGLPGAPPARPQSQEPPSQGEVLLSVFMEFWLADGDSPLPGAAAPGGGSPSSGPSTPNARGAARDGWKEYNDSWGGLLTMRSSSFKAVSFELLSEDLVEALVFLARYIVAEEIPGSKDTPFRLAQAGGAAWLPLSPVQPIVSMQMPRAVGSAYLPPSLGAAARPPAQAFARSLYRLLHRAFTQWPDHRTITPVVRLWCAYMAPWWPPNGAAAAAASYGSTAGAGAGASQKQQQQQQQQPQASPAGPPQALRRQLSSAVGELVHTALGDAHPQSHGDSKAGRFSKAQWQAHVLANLPFYSLLLPLFLDLVRSRVSFRCDESLEDLERVLVIFAQSPELCELIAAVEADYARYVQHPGRRPEGPYAEVLPFLAEQAQDWEAAALATSTTCPPVSALPEFRLFSREAGGAAAKAADALAAAAGAGRESLLAEVRALAAAVLPMQAAELSTAQPAGAVAAAAPPLAPVRALQLGRREVLAYRGDPLRRPLASNEIAWLARLLVRASDAANAALGLKRRATDQETAAGGPVQRLKELLRANGGINLRNPWGLCLAEVQTLVWIPLVLTVLWLSWHTLAFVWQVLTQPYDEEPHPSSSRSYVAGHEHLPHNHEIPL